MERGRWLQRHKRPLDLEKIDQLIREKTEILEEPELILEPVISVCVPTFNHGRFIEEALDSILMQEVAVPFEIVIGDDASTDGTSQILDDYQARFPEKIRIFRSVENLGHHTRSGSLNATRILEGARGKYVALVEGDDYWTDPNKLQTQFDFLEKPENSGLVGCFHFAELIDEDGQVIRPVFVEHPCDQYDARRAFAEVRSSYATSSFFYRKKALPDWYRLYTNDMHLELVLLAYGDIGLIRRNMSVYRVQAGGVWQSLSGDEQIEVMLDRFTYLQYQSAVRELLKDSFVSVVADYSVTLLEDEASSPHLKNLAQRQLLRVGLDDPTRVYKLIEEVETARPVAKALKVASVLKPICPALKSC